MKWGHLQRECHRLLDEVFGRQEGYRWLNKTFGISHFSKLKYPEDHQKLEEIYRHLHILSFKQ